MQCLFGRVGWLDGRLAKICRLSAAEVGVAESCSFHLETAGGAPSRHRARATLHSVEKEHHHRHPAMDNFSIHAHAHAHSALHMWRDPAPGDQTLVQAAAAAAAVGELAQVTGSPFRHWLGETCQNHEAGSGF